MRHRQCGAATRYTFRKTRRSMMQTELTMLGWSIALGLAGVLLAAGMTTGQRGLRWNVSNRDGTAPPITGAAARATRASSNFLETFVFFAAAALAVALTNRGSA